MERRVGSLLRNYGPKEGNVVRSLAEARCEVRVPNCVAVRYFSVVADGDHERPERRTSLQTARDNLAFVTLPSYSPELNPVEECWRQLQAALSNRFFDSLDELTTAIDTALEQLSIPKVSNYF